MAHTPCDQVAQATETANNALITSATINGKLNVLIGLHSTLIAAIVWIFLRVDAHETRITQCCIDAKRIESIETDVRQSMLDIQRLASRRPAIYGPFKAD